MAKGKIPELDNTYVILLTKKCVKWDNFNEMARTVASYASALPVCVPKYGYECAKI
jgi:CRISPR-associated endonuclease/helicase Cas3